VNSLSPFPLLWFLAIIAIFIADSAVLISLLLDITIPYLAYIDSHAGRALLGGVLVLMVLGMIKIIAVSEEPTHLYVATVLSFIYALLFLLWAGLGHLGHFNNYTMLNSNSGKWAFTIACTILFLPWLGGFRGQIHTASNALRMQIYKQEHGRLYGFLYAWSGAVYLLFKLYVLIGIGIYIFFQAEWDDFLNGEEVFSNLLESGKK